MLDPALYYKVHLIQEKTFALAYDIVKKGGDLIKSKNDLLMQQAEISPKMYLKERQEGPWYLKTQDVGGAIRRGTEIKRRTYYI